MASLMQMSRNRLLYVVALVLACACVLGGVLVVQARADRADARTEQERYGDWLLRAGAGFTGRANSALVVGDPPGPLDAAVADVGRWYAARGLRPQAQVPLPGAGAADPDEDYALLAVADPADAVAEDDADPTAEDNTAALAGAYHRPGGPVFVHGTGEADPITVRSVGTAVELTVNGAARTYPAAGVTGVRVRRRRPSVGWSSACQKPTSCRCGSSSRSSMLL